MPTAIPLRDDFDGPELRALAKVSRNPVQVRRLLALAEIYDGGSRSAAARLGGVGVQSIRDWVLRFNAEGRLKVGGEVAVSLPVELLANTDAVLGVGVGFSVIRSGLQRFFLRADAARPGNVLLSVKSGRSESSSVSRRLGVQIDFTEFFVAIRPQLQQPSRLPEGVAPSFPPVRRASP